MLLLYDLLLVGSLLSHINCHSHCPHDAAIQIIQRGFIGGQKPVAFPGLHDLLRDTGLPFLHNNPLRLNTGRVILIHIPDISMPLAFHLLPGLVDCPTKTVIDLLVDTILGLVPREIRHIVDGSIQILPALPQILLHLIGLLPSNKPESDLIIRSLAQARNSPRPSA